MGGAKTAIALGAAGAALLASGCQSTCDTCGYVETVAANYRALASCVAGERIDPPVESRPGVVVDTNREAGIFGGPEVVEDDAAARRIVVDVNSYTDAGYRLIFTGLTELSTEVRGQPLGVNTVYFWPEQAAPLVARCSGRILR
jgi:hypothetical protein